MTGLTVPPPELERDGHAGIRMLAVSPAAHRRGAGGALSRRASPALARTEQPDRPARRRVDDRGTRALRAVRVHPPAAPRRPGAGREPDGIHARSRRRRARHE